MALASWKKIDFHTHSPESTCFRRKVTPREWIEAVTDSGLDAVVLTDHNSVGWVGILREELRSDDNLFIFPGVELCVGTKFIHILIIFDPKMETNEIEDFLIEAGISRSDWGDTTKYVKEEKLAEMLKDKKFQNKFLVVPAHFTANKGLCKELNQNGIKEFYINIPFHAIEVRNENDINEVKNKQKNGIFPSMAVITGSDNPGNKEGEHCISGFGKAYTWVKLSEFSLEALRQVFLDFETRSYCVLQGGTEQEDFNEVQHNYVSGMTIKELKHVKELNFRLSPHLNCIIGGRGTGKSTIIEMMKLVVSNINKESYNTVNSNRLLDTYKDSTRINFYYNFGTNKSYCVHVSGKKNNKEFTVESEAGIISDFPSFPVSIFSQKELFNLVENDNKASENDTSPLLDIIDDNIAIEKFKCQEKIENIRKEIINLIGDLNIKRNQIKEIPRLKADIEINTSRLSKLKDEEIIDKRKRLNKLKTPYSIINQTLNDNTDLIENLIEKCIDKKDFLNQGIIELSEDSEILSDQDKNMLTKIIQLNNNLMEYLNNTKIEVERLKEELISSDLKAELTKLEIEYNKVLEETGVNNIEEFSSIEMEINQQSEKLNKLNTYEEQIGILTGKIRSKLYEYIEAHKELTTLRKRIISQINLKASNIKLNIHSLSHHERWMFNLRKELGKQNTFDKDFAILKDKLFNDGVINEIEFVKWLEYISISEIKEITNFLMLDEINDSRFINIWSEKKKDNTLHTLLNFMPEDRVEIKILNNGYEMSINEGSPGQKTAAILAFILNQGKNPLIIDQPEDDLDNSLIINLIVENIRKLKSERQIIIATHNPNIPVLGDAEGIIMLDRDDNGLVSFKNGKKTGCIEEKTIKQGICDIMEGGIDAFKKREGKYKYIE